jgi:hypothetical protein
LDSAGNAGIANIADNEPALHPDQFPSLTLSAAGSSFAIAFQFTAMSALSAMTAFLADRAIPANFPHPLESCCQPRIVLSVTPMVSKPSSDYGLAESLIAPRAWVFVGWRDLHQIRKDTGEPLTSFP